MFLLFSNKRYYILENKKGQICLVDGPFLSVNKCKKVLSNSNQWIQLLNSRELANLLS